MTAGSSSAPTFFDPLQGIDKYNITTEYIDGGVVGNNPSFYSYVMSNELLDKEDITLVSLGTGMEKDSLEFDKAKNRFNNYLASLSSWITDIEMVNAHFLLKSILPPDRYIRMQCYSNAKLDSVS